MSNEPYLPQAPFGLGLVTCLAGAFPATMLALMALQTKDVTGFTHWQLAAAVAGAIGLWWSVGARPTRVSAYAITVLLVLGEWAALSLLVHFRLRGDELWLVNVGGLFLFLGPVITGFLQMRRMIAAIWRASVVPR